MKRAPGWARLFVLLSKALRGAADEGALGSRPLCSVAELCWKGISHERRKPAYFVKTISSF